VWSFAVDLGAAFGVLAVYLARRARARRQSPDA
jgi:hypothetical protein